MPALPGVTTLLILNRFGGSMLDGAATLGSITGLLSDDQENPFSFTFRGGCQIRQVLSKDFPRTTPRLTSLITPGRSGWMKLWAVDDAGILGMVINANPGAKSNQSAYRQGRNLHKLKLTNTATLTIPVHPPNCQ